MKRRFARDQRGATAVEFALVAPALMTVMWGATSLGLALWVQNALQDASAEGARCSAIGSILCASADSGCDSGNPAICYTEAMAAQRAPVKLSASNVSVNASLTVSGVSFTQVTVSYPWSLLGITVTLGASSMFPN